MCSQRQLVKFDYDKKQKNEMIFFIFSKNYIFFLPDIELYMIKCILLKYIMLIKIKTAKFETLLIFSDLQIKVR